MTEEYEVFHLSNLVLSLFYDTPVWNLCCILGKSVAQGSFFLACFLNKEGDFRRTVARESALERNQNVRTKLNQNLNTKMSLDPPGSMEKVEKIGMK